MGRVEEFIVGSDGILWHKHAWNSYKGVHFDVMMDMKRDAMKNGLVENHPAISQWFYYEQYKSTSHKELRNSKKAKKCKSPLHSINGFISGSFESEGVRWNESFKDGMENGRYSSIPSLLNVA